MRRALLILFLASFLRNGEGSRLLDSVSPKAQKESQSVEERAASGDLDAMLELGVALGQKIGKPISLAQDPAAVWLRKVALQEKNAELAKRAVAALDELRTRLYTGHPEVPAKEVERKNETLGIFLYRKKETRQLGFETLLEEGALLSSKSISFLEALYKTSAPREIPDFRKRTLDLFESLSNQGSPTASFFLGSVYLQGIAVPKDEKKGESLLAKANSRPRFGEAYVLIAELDFRRGDSKGFEDNLKRAADLNYPPGMYNYGVFLRQKKKYDEAFTLFKKTVDQDKLNYAAMVNLAQMYLEGWGTEKNDSLGIQWYQKAADEGKRPEAQYYLGLYYLNGMFGVEKSREKGLSYLNRSAVAQYPAAVKLLQVESRKSPIPQGPSRTLTALREKQYIPSPTEISELEAILRDEPKSDIPNLVAKYKKLSEQYPDSPRVKAQLILFMIKAGSLDGANDLLTLTLSNFPDDAELKVIERHLPKIRGINDKAKQQEAKIAMLEEIDVVHKVFMESQPQSDSSGEAVGAGALSADVLRQKLQNDASAGKPEALFQMALHHFDGSLGVRKSRIRALNYLEKAAGQKYAPAVSRYEHEVSRERARIRAKYHVEPHYREQYLVPLPEAEAIEKADEELRKTTKNDFPEYHRILKGNPASPAVAEQFCLSLIVEKDEFRKAREILTSALQKFPEQIYLLILKDHLAVIEHESEGIRRTDAKRELIQDLRTLQELLEIYRAANDSPAPKGGGGTVK